MELAASGNAIKILNRAVTCLAKIGTELIIECLPSQIVFRTLNSSRSAFLAISFKAEYFDAYRLFSGQTHCSVLLKAVCTIFRTPSSSIEKLLVLLPDSEAMKLQWRLDCLNGVRKTYSIACNYQPEIQHLALDKSNFQSHLVVKPRDLLKLLSNFQSSLAEITLIATEPVLSSEVDSDTAGKAIELRSYIDPVKDNRIDALHTQLWIDPMEELQSYHHKGAPVDVTFSVKELKAFIAFCEGCEVDIEMCFNKAGEPILLAPKFGLNNSAHTEFDATLVLATMLSSQLTNQVGPTDLRPDNHAVQEHRHTGSHIPTEPRAATFQNFPTTSHHSPSGKRGGIASTHPDSASDHTVIWSDVTGV